MPTCFPWLSPPAFSQFGTTWVLLSWGSLGHGTVRDMPGRTGSDFWQRWWFLMDTRISRYGRSGVGNCHSYLAVSLYYMTRPFVTELLVPFWQSYLGYWGNSPGGWGPASKGGGVNEICCECYWLHILRTGQGTWLHGLRAEALLQCGVNMAHAWFIIQQPGKSRNIFVRLSLTHTHP